MLKHYALSLAVLALGTSTLSAQKVQLVHNSPDAGKVNIYLLKNNGTAGAADVFKPANAIARGVDFRQASGFVDVGTAAATFGVALVSDTTNGLVLNLTGLTATTRAYAIVTGKASGTPGLEVKVSNKAFDVDGTGLNAAVFHGGIGAPAVDVVARGVGPIVSNISYGEYKFIENGTVADLTLDIAPTGTMNYVASYRGVLQSAGIKSVLVVASGIFGSTNDADRFGLAAYIPAGGNAILLSEVDIPTSVSGKFEAAATSIYPNPTSGRVNVALGLNEATAVRLTLTDLVGRTVKSMDLGSFGVGAHTTEVNLSDVPAGIYTYTLNGELAGKLIIN
jgi:hypothetical protein